MLSKRKIKQKFKRAVQKCKNKNKEQRNNFICLLNHDIKTPILAHMQTLNLLLKGKFGELNDMQKELLGEILNSNYFILQVLINQIFILNCENKNYRLNLEKVNLIDEIDTCIGSISSILKEKHQRVILKVDKKVSLQADRKMVQKIIYNILHASVCGAFEKSDVEVRVCENKKMISFSVKNKTSFMTKEKIESMLDDKKNSLCDFNQLGMSLNLNIAKKLINAHHWDLIANSRHDNSSTFGFLICK